MEDKLSGRALSKRQTTLLLVTGLLILTIAAACGVTPQVKEITQIVPVYQTYQVTQIIEVTRAVQVTQVVPVQQIVRITEIVMVPLYYEVPPPAVPQEAPTPPPEPPAMVEAATEAPPAATAPPASTEAPRTPQPIRKAPTATRSAPTAVKEVLVWYDFEDNYLAAGSVADRSGSGHDAQITGVVGMTTGINGGQAALFSGNGYLQAPVNPAAGRTKLTFSLWFKTDDPTANYKLASGAWWNGGPGSGWLMATHIPEFWSEDTLGIYLPNQSNADNHFTAGEWIQEVVTYDGHRIREYTNGQLVNDWAATGAAIGQGQPLAVGAWPQFQGYNFRGAIDEFKIYGRCLSASEILAAFNQKR